MRNNRNLHLLNRGACFRRLEVAAIAVAVGLCAGGHVLGAEPVVERVEPPSWWAGHSHNPVRLMISGEHLSDARLIVPDGFGTGDMRVSEDGGYLFVDLDIPSGGRPGKVPLRLVTDGGETTVPFELNAPLPPTGRFQGFSTDDVIYLLMPDRFANGDPSNDDPADSPGLLDRSRPRHYHGGDLQGVLDRLDYLRALGVTALWLTPWYDNANVLNVLEKYNAENKLSSEGTPSTDYHGYGAVDFYAVEEHFGDLPLLREFVATVQAGGMKVVQDQVANHTGPLHEWVERPPTPTWYNGTAADHLPNSWQTWTIAATNPPPDKLKSTLEGWFIDILPDLNQNDPEVATYLIQNSLWWVGMTGLDAVRQDTLPYVPRSYWAQWTAALKRQYPDLTILGEMFDGDPGLVSFFQGGQPRFDGVDSGIDTLFDFPLFYAIRNVFAKGQPMTVLADTFAADTNYVDPTVLVTFLGLHDTPRFLHEPGATVQGLRQAFTLLFTTRGTPMIYYGDEIAMNGAGDPKNRRDFPGGWAEDPANAFESSGRTSHQSEVHDHVTELLSLRRELEPLRRGDLVHLVVDTNTYVFARKTETSFAIVAFNQSTNVQSIECSLAGLTSAPVHAVTDRLGGLGSLTISDAQLQFNLPPRRSALFVPEPVIIEARKEAEDDGNASTGFKIGK